MTDRPHIVDGEFQSDKYPTCPAGKVPLSTKDPMAQDLLWEYAQRRRSVDAAFADDLEWALKSKGYVPVAPKDAALSVAVKPKRFCKCGHPLSAHERDILPDEADARLRHDCNRLHDALKDKAIDADEHGKRISSLISEAFSTSAVKAVGGCRACGLGCSSYKDAGEIGQQAERIQALEERVASLEAR